MAETIMPVALMSHLDPDPPNPFDAASVLEKPQIMISGMDAYGAYSGPPAPYMATPEEIKNYIKCEVQDKDALQHARTIITVGLIVMVIVDFFVTFVPALLFIIFVFSASIGSTLIGTLFLARLSSYIYIWCNMHLVHLAAATQAIIKNGTNSIVPRFMNIFSAVGSHDIFKYEYSIMGYAISFAVISINLAILQRPNHTTATFVLAIVYGGFHTLWPLVQHFILKKVILERSLESYDAAYIKKTIDTFNHPIPIRRMN